MPWNDGVKLMIPYRNGIVVCTLRDELFYGEPECGDPYSWIWRRI